MNEVTSITLRHQNHSNRGTTGIGHGDDDSTQPEDEDDHDNDDSNFSSIVNEMKNKNLLDDEDYINSVVQDRKFMAKHCMRGKNKDCRYAIKKMRKECYEDSDKFINTIVDLVIEAKFLSVVRHPNIIKIRAISAGIDLFQSPSTNSFIILDKLYGTLTEKLDKWLHKEKHGGIAKLFDFQKKKEKAFFAERLTVAYDVASALSYLHDLK